MCADDANKMYHLCSKMQESKHRKVLWPKKLSVNKAALSPRRYAPHLPYAFNGLWL